MQTDPQHAVSSIGMGGALLAEVDLHGIANLDEARLHVEPVRQAVELAGPDLTRDLEAVAQNLDVERRAGDPAAMRPFLLVASFVNPHDIVLFPTWVRRTPLQEPSPLDPPPVPAASRTSGG